MFVRIKRYIGNKGVLRNSTLTDPSTNPEMELRTQGEASWLFSSICDVSYFSAYCTCIPEMTNVKVGGFIVAYVSGFHVLEGCVGGAEWLTSWQRGRREAVELGEGQRDGEGQRMPMPTGSLPHAHLFVCTPNL